MKRRLVGAGIAAAAMLAVPGAALAQGVPPGPPATIYGSITPGQVIVIVINGSSSTCGAGSVVSDSGSTVFVVDVISDSQRGLRRQRPHDPLRDLPGRRPSRQIHTDAPAPSSRR
jgi:hypothetical protein